jgi:hypothetical protein
MKRYKHEQTKRKETDSRLQNFLKMTKNLPEICHSPLSLLPSSPNTNQEKDTEPDRFE